MFKMESDNFYGDFMLKLKEYCQAAHSQRQNKGFLSHMNQDPIFI